MNGKIGDPHYHSEFRNVDEEIDFLERVCDIQEYLGKEISIPDTITEDQYRTLLHISDLLRGKNIQEKWADTTITGIVDQHFRDSIKELGAGPHKLALVGNSERELFNEIVTIRCVQEFQEAWPRVHAEREQGNPAARGAGETTVVLSIGTRGETGGIVSVQASNTWRDAFRFRRRSCAACNCSQPAAV